MKYLVEFENYILKWNSCLVFRYVQRLEKVKQNKKEKSYIRWGAEIVFLQVLKIPY